MCARFTLSTDEKAILKEYSGKFVEPYNPNYNLAPTNNGSVITADEPASIHQYHFGLVPFWADDTKIGTKMLNARAESVLSLRSFKPLMEKNKRCLVLADGFYEWKPEAGSKQPYRFILPDRPVFAFAGLWSRWVNKETKDIYNSFTIITTKPNKIMSDVHDRMPVILGKDEEHLWLSDDVPMKDLTQLLDPYPDDEMEKYPVSKAVNKPVNNSPELILPQNSK